MPLEMKRPYKFGGGSLVVSGALFVVLAFLDFRTGPPPSNGAEILLWRDSQALVLDFVSESLFIATVLLVPGTVALYQSLVDVDRTKAGMIGSENGRSADTYAVTSRDDDIGPPQPASNIAPTAAAHNDSAVTASRLFRPICKVVELRHAVCLGPDAHFSGILERLVVPIEGFLAVEHHDEVAALELDSQPVPLTAGHGHPGALLLHRAISD